MATALFRRKTFILLLLIVLTPPWASATGSPAAQPGPAALSSLVSLDVLSFAWRFLSNPWRKEGCHIDPSGACLPLSTSVNTEGCRIDPDGHCAPEPAQVDTGCGIDPNGLCRF